MSFRSKELKTLNLKKMKSIEGRKRLISIMSKTSLLLLLLTPIISCSKDDDEPEQSVR